MPVATGTVTFTVTGTGSPVPITTITFTISVDISLSTTPSAGSSHPSTTSQVCTTTPASPPCAVSSGGVVAGIAIGYTAAGLVAGLLVVYILL